MTGVQRVADNLVSATLDRGRVDPRTGRLALSMLCPAGTVPPSPLARPGDPQSRLRGQPWEQIELPLRAGGGQLINLCNQGPLSRSGDLIMIHDAQPLMVKHSYSQAFAAWYKFSLPILGSRAEIVFTVSDFAKNCLIETGIAPEEKIRVIKNGVDHILKIDSLPIDPALNLSPRGYVVAMSSLHRHKNIRVLLKAMELLSDTDIKLVLVGAPTPQDFTEMGHNLPRNVVFAGRASDGTMRGLIEGAAAFAFPSTTEGFGLPPLEAMTLGTPAIVAPNGAVPEICGSGARYEDPDDPEAWAHAIRTLAENAGERQALAQAGLSMARQYTWDRAAEQFIDVLAEVTE